MTEGRSHQRHTHLVQGAGPGGGGWSSRRKLVCTQPVTEGWGVVADGGGSSPLLQQQWLLCYCPGWGIIWAGPSTEASA